MNPYEVFSMDRSRTWSCEIENVYTGPANGDARLLVCSFYSDFRFRREDTRQQGFYAGIVHAVFTYEQPSV
jgi:hypothetical protein